MFSKIIFVCVGNTCRSPMAATIMHELVQDKNIIVESRGMIVLFPEPYNSKAIAVARAHGFIMPSNTAKQIEAEDFGNDTLVLTMNYSMKEKIYAAFANAINVYTLSEFAGEGEYEVQDPYGRGVEAYNKCFEEIYALIEKAAVKAVGSKENEES